MSVEEACSIAIENRPDLLALRLKVAQSQANIELERRRGYPEITPTFGYTRQYQTKAIGFPDANSWSASIEVTLPVFDRNQGNRMKAASIAAQNRFELRAQEVSLNAEIKSIVQELRTAHANAEAVASDQL